MTQQIQTSANVSKSMQPQVRASQNVQIILTHQHVLLSQEVQKTTSAHQPAQRQVPMIQKTDRDVNVPECETAQHVSLMLEAKQDDQCSRDTVSTESMVRSASSESNVRYQ